MRTRYAGRWVTAAVLGLVALGCAQPGARDGDSSPLPSPGPSRPGRTTDADGQALPPGDAAPHQADNNSWKRRHELTAEEQRAARCRIAGEVDGFEGERLARLDRDRP